MARRYDSRTTVFSPDGHLYQVEYAMMAVSEAGPCIGIVTSDGIILAAEKRGSQTKLLDNTIGLLKISKITDDIVCAVAGIASDANVLVSELRQIAQRYEEQYEVSMSCERLVRWLSDIKHAYTQFGGKRPFGVSILYAGWDEQFGYQVYKSDPSGDYSGWKACCIGANNETAMDILKEEYEEDCSLQDGIKLAIRVLLGITKKTELTEDMIEVVILTREQTTRIGVLSEIKKGKLMKCLKAETVAGPSRGVRMMASGEQNL